MASYAFNNSVGGSLVNLTTATYKTTIIAGCVTGATTLRRIWVTEFEWAANDVPNATDCMIATDISKFTAAGTSTSIVPPGSDGLIDAAALGTYGVNASVEPTYSATTSVFFKNINQRASDKQWWRDKATCPISPAVTANGLGIRHKSTNYASTMIVNALVEE